MLPFFNPSNTKAWEEPIRDICRRRLDDLDGRTEFDLAVQTQVETTCAYALEAAARYDAMMPFQDTGRQAHRTTVAGQAADNPWRVDAAAE